MGSEQETGRDENSVSPPNGNADNWLWWVAGIVVALLLLAVITYSPVLRYYHLQDSSFVGALGILLAYYGLGLGVVGFGLTWWQLARTKSAAVAAKNAVRRLKNDFASFDVLLELRTAKTNADECRRLLSQTEWSGALQSYDRIRASLLKMAVARLGLDDTTLARLTSFTAAATAAILDLEAKVRDLSLATDVTSLSSTLLEMDEFFVELEHLVRDKISGS